MKKIDNYLIYEGGEIRPHTLYVYGSEPIVVDGIVDFTIFGTGYMNGIKLSNYSMYANLSTVTTFKLQKDSAILFAKAPHEIKLIPENVPVPDIPDFLDAQEAQMRYMFESWAKDKGLIQPDNDDDNDTDIDIDIDDDSELFDISCDLDLDPILDDDDIDDIQDEPLEEPEPLPEPAEITETS